MAKLTAATVRGLRAPGKYGDGNGLWFQVSGASQRSWLARFTLAGKPREMGLGSAEEVSLAEAREKNEAVRKLVRDGVDPIEHRRAIREAAAQAEEHNVTFAQAARLYIAANASGWRNAKHAAQWDSSLAAYAFQVLGDLRCREIGTNHVLKVLEPIWHIKPETATRVRGRIETILSYATVRGWRDGPNPAIWRGHLQLMLPAKSKVRQVKHHAALDWREMPAFMRTLREQPGMGAAALMFAVLTGARSGEVRGATWSEIDMDVAVWSRPAQRMKSHRAHRVPLSKSALDLLAEVRPLRVDDASVIFPGQVRTEGRHAPLSNMSLTAALRRMGRGDLTAHGFRSTFRDWAAETTGYPSEVAEMALAHAVGDKVEAAYRRGDLFEKRKALMSDWAAYVGKPPAEVLTLRRRQIG